MREAIHLYNDARKGIFQLNLSAQQKVLCLTSADNIILQCLLGSFYLTESLFPIASTCFDVGTKSFSFFLLL
jgi:hypothetical protein